MTKKAEVGRVGTGIEGLNELPFGSLLLLASHQRKWRDLAGMNAAIYAAYAGPVLYLTFSELGGLAQIRWRDQLETNCRVWASNEALEVAGAKPIDRSTGWEISRLLERRTMTEEESKATKRELAETFRREDEAWRHKHDSAQAAALSRLQREGADLSITFRATHSPTLDWLLEQLASAPVRSSVVLDDLAAIRKDAKHPGSPKHCGEHARILKDVALERQLLIAAGVPTAEVRDKRAGEERSLTLDDLAPYGAPDLCADAVVTAMPGAERHRFDGVERILLARY